MLECSVRDDSEIACLFTSVGQAKFQENREPADAGYRIGATSRLTGITADTLRVWERRYGVVTPRRSPKGGRHYSLKDVSRLALNKQLVDAGHAIGSVARLETKALQERLEAKDLATVATKSEMARGCAVAVLGEALPARLRANEDQVRDLEFVTVTRDSDTFAKAVSDHKAPPRAKTLSDETTPCACRPTVPLMPCGRLREV